MTLKIMKERISPVPFQPQGRLLLLRGGRNDSLPHHCKGRLVLLKLMVVPKVNQVIGMIFLKRVTCNSFCQLSSQLKIITSLKIKMIKNLLKKSLRAI
jgi:hypothetical protein